MKPGFQAAGRAGFTLIEVLVSLGLCAVLASATASAVAFAARAERIADRQGEASLLLPSLYAAQRLRPDDLPAAPRGWEVARTPDPVVLPDGTLHPWNLLAVAQRSHDVPPFTLRILDAAP
ncbi:MAG: type II secretion system protein [Kiritimatiellia bacterium]